MNKTLKYFLDLVIGSIIVWLLVALAFRSELFFGKDEDDNGNGNNTLDPNAEFQDGVYTGTARGFKSEIIVEVTITDGKITNVLILEHDESEGISDPAIDQIPALIIEQNRHDVDSVTGATRTSNGIMQAVLDALIKSQNANND